MANLLSTTVNGQLNTGNVIDLGYTVSGSIATSEFRGINFHAFSDFHYYIGKPAGAWVQPLHIHFYTGIWLRSHHSYGGTRFYNIATGSQLMSVGDGSDNVTIYSGLTVSGTITTQGNTVVHTGGGQTIAGITYFSNGESLNLYGIRGRFTNEYIHLYHKVGIGHPGGWGQGEGNTPGYGLSTYGGATIAYGNSAGMYVYGSISTDTYVYTNASVRVGEIWGDGGLYRSSGIMLFGTENEGWRFSMANSQKMYIGTDGNIWMAWAGDYISNLLAAKQNASTAINTGNIGSQSVNYASSAGNADTLDGYQASAFLYNQVSQLSGTDLNNLTTQGVYHSGDQYGTNPNIPFENYFTMINLTNDAGRQAQIWFGDTPGTMYWRPRQGDSTQWHSWEKVITSNNIGSQSVGNADTVDGYHANNAAGGIPTLESNGYWYAPSWIHVGGTGIFSGTNNAHFYPNDGSYGSWKILGSRNDYRGLQFGSGVNGDVSLMIHVNSNITGFHNASYDWQFFWSGGTLYCFKNTYGGGTQATVLDSSNYSSWAQPASTAINTGNIASQSVSYATSAGNADTIEGLSSSVFVRNDVYNSADNGLQVFRNIGTIDGSWPSAEHTFGLENSDAGNIVINFHRGGYTSNNLWYNGSQFRFDQVVTSTADFRAPIFYDSNDTNYYLDPNSSGTSLKINGGIVSTAGSGAVLLKHEVSEANSWIFRENAPNWGLFWLNQGGETGQTIGSYTTVGAELFGMNNAVSGYAPSGEWSGTDNNTRAAWMLSNYSGYLWTQGTQYSETDMRAPIFYDSNDTSFYVDPASPSRIRNLYVGDSGSNWVDTGGWGTQFHVSNGPHAIFKVFARNEGIETGMYSHVGGQSKAGSFSNHDFAIVRNWDVRMTFYSGYTYVNNYLQAADSLRAPIFYDSADTGYYVDPNSTSRMYQINYDYLYYAPDTNYGFLATNVYVDTINSGYNSDPLELVYYRGTEVRVGSNGGDKDIRAGRFVNGVDTTYYIDLDNTGASMYAAGYIKSKYTYRYNSGAGLPGQDYPVKTASGVLATFSASGASYSYIIIKTRIPQDWYQMGGFKIDLFGQYSGNNTKTTISLGGYWNPEGNGGFIGFEYNTTNPNVRPTIEVMRDITDGMTCFVIHGLTWSYPVVVARDLYLGYNSDDIEGGLDWSIFGADDLGGYTNNDTVICRTAIPADQWYGNTYIHYDGRHYGTIFYDSNDSAYYCDPNATSRLHIIKLSTDQWNQSSDGYNRLYFGNNARTYFGSGNGYEFRSAADANIGSISNSGDFVAAGDVTAYSDARIKTNVQTIDNALGKTLKLRGVTYNRTDSEDTSTKVGVIAQEILEVIPEVVKQNDEGVYSVSYGNLTAVLIEAIKEQQKQIDELKDIINGLTK